MAKRNVLHNNGCTQPRARTEAWPLGVRLTETRATSRPFTVGRSRSRAALGAPRTDRIARIALPIACAAAWWAIAAYQREPPVAAEARYLGFLAAAILLAALHAAPRVGTLLGSAAVLLSAIPWALPGTPDRGAAASVLLAGILGIAATSSLTAEEQRPPRLAALAIGAQLLARGGELLAPTTATVIGIVLWAGVAAAAMLVLEARRGAIPALLAGGTAFVLGPGFTATSALALAAPALALLAADRERAMATRVAAVVALIAPLLWDFERGALLLAGAIAFAAPPWARWTAGLAGLAAFFAPSAERAAGLAGPAWLLFLLPIVVAEPRAEAATRFAAICLALGAAAQSPDRAMLALPAVLIAGTVTGAAPLPATLQASWTGILAMTSAILAAYPWLRPDAISGTAALLGLSGGGDDAHLRAWQAALLALVLLGAAAAASRLLARSSIAAAILAPRTLAVLLVPLALAHHPAVAVVPIARQPVQLDPGTRRWEARIDPPVSVARLVLDSTLSHAATVPAGTVIAEIVVTTPDGDRILPLRAGVDTGEWAARRPDVAAIPGFTAPEPFLYWVDAGGRFFGQRYRARASLEVATEATAIEVRLAPGAPPDLVLTLFHLELQR